uniref:Retrovirus-related Pol polyprotein LINE-1 n=2 Tax=Sipha flava TaxID=143950 RepID=A0A2S2R9T9_9HEMI
MPNLSHPSYYQITSIFHFFALNLNSSPNNATVILSHVKSSPYYTTHNTFGVLLGKNRSFQSIPSYVSLHGKQSTSPSDTANLFASYFSSVFTQPSPTPSQTLHSICLFPLPSNAYFSISDVYKCLWSLRNIKSVGPDGIQGDFLYKLRSVLAEPLWLLFRRSIDSGIFPSALKLGLIRPIFKSCNSTDVSNYRPITILPHLSKIFETLVLNSVRSSLNHILIDEKHGFHPGRSTITCNLSLHSYIYMILFAITSK